MISKLFRHISRDDSIARLYGTIVAQARAPAFYQIYGVPDTVNGRLEMIMLHAVLVLRRLESEAMPVRALGQKLFDHFCRDMDGQHAGNGRRRSCGAAKNAPDRRGVLWSASSVSRGVGTARGRAAYGGPTTQYICRRVGTRRSCRACGLRPRSRAAA